MSGTSAPGLSWLGVVRLGLVQTAIGAIVVLVTSTMNRVMVVELALPAALPGALVAWHYAVQMARPRWGHGADVGGRRAPWIVGGMAALALGAVGAALSVGLMATSPWLGTLAAMAAFALVGGGVGAAGTNLLALLAATVAPSRKPAAAAVVWIMMIFGFAVTAGVAGGLLTPFSLARLVAVTAGVGALAVGVSALALIGIDRMRTPSAPAPSATPFRAALASVLRDPEARLFTIFVFVAMLAYSAQDLILEPFAGLRFGYDPGASTRLAGVQHGGALLGMIATAIVAGALARTRPGVARAWTIGGCLASAMALVSLAAAAAVGPGWPLKWSVFALGLANGAFAVAAVGAMMGLAGEGREAREGARMGLFGAAQAIAFGLGSFLGTAAVDLMRALIDADAVAYGTVFAAEGLVFLIAAALAPRLSQGAPSHGAAAVAGE